MRRVASSIIRSVVGRGSKKRLRLAKRRVRRLQIESLERRSVMTAGELDLSFGNNGHVTTEFDNTATWGRTALCSALQPDGKIIAAGEGALVRYHPDGTLDASFGESGRVAFPYFAQKIALQTNGRIVVVGKMLDSSQQDFVVARYLSNGTLDNSFDGDGIVLTDFGGVDAANDVAIQSNGRIVVVGSTDNKIAIARFLANGTLDTSFDADGKYVKNFSSHRSDNAFAVALQSDGKIVVAGTSWVTLSSTQSNHDFFVMRLHSRGALDRTFDSDGVAFTNFGFDPVSRDEARDVAIDSNGKIVVSGYAYASYEHNLAIARYLPDGTPDSTFNTNNSGWKTVRFSGYSNNQIAGESVALHPDGRILTMAGADLYQFNADASLDTTFSTDGILRGVNNAKTCLIQPDGRIVTGGSNIGRFEVRRYDAAGDLDLSFSLDGFVETAFGPSLDEAKASTLQADGKLVVVGQSLFGFGIARYQVDGSPDMSFSQIGRTVVDFGPLYESAGATDVTVQADGKIVVVGFAKLKGQTHIIHFATARLNADGSLDNSFSADGKAITNVDGFGWARSVDVQNDGRILVGGGSNYQSAFTLLRYTVDGALDTSFSGDGIAQVITGGGTSSSITALKLLGDGTILAGGEFYPLSNRQYESGLMIAKFRANGSLDQSFANNGRIVDLYNNQRSVSDLAVRADGSFVVTGGTTTYDRFGNRTSNMVVSSYSSTGQLVGQVIPIVHVPTDGDIFSERRADSVASSIVAQPDGKFILAGRYSDSVLVLRLNADGTPDTTFHGDGQLVMKFSSKYSLLANILQQSDGRILVIGSTYTPSQIAPNYDFAIARLLDHVPTTEATLVTVNSAGNIEINDRWSRDNQFEILRSGDSIVLTDTTRDSSARLEIIGVPEAMGNGTKQIAIPLATIVATGRPLVVNGFAGDDLFTFAGDEDPVPATGLLIQGGVGNDKFSLVGSLRNGVWSISEIGNGTVTPSGQLSRRFTGIENAAAGQFHDLFRLGAGNASTLVSVDGGGVSNTIQMMADSDIELGRHPYINDQSSISFQGNINQRISLRGISDAVISGGAGDNLITASQFQGTVRLNGGPGNDRLFGTRNNDVLLGGEGNDIIFGDYGDDLLRGGDGSDLLVGEDGADTIFGDSGNDILIGGFGSDLLNGGLGEDLLIGGHCIPLQRTADEVVRNSLMFGWYSSDSYSDRITLLRDTGVEGSTRLAPHTTIFDDHTVDTLIGGSDLDWFFASNADNGNELNLATSGLRDLENGETLTVIN